MMMDLGLCLEYTAAQSKEQLTAKEYQAAINEHQRLHQATEQAKAAAENARHAVSLAIQVEYSC
jgi:hypothetical protein